MRNIRTYKHLLCIALLYTAGWLMLVTSGCANKGTGPQGGPKDSIPPTLLRETPLNGTCNFTGKTVVLQFDEYVQLNNVAENVLISPPQQNPPIVKAIGKRVTVTFEEELRDSTTYTIDFGEAICDNNEKVPLGNYSFSFSTGEHIDTLAMFGKVINAADLCIEYAWRQLPHICIARCEQGLSVPAIRGIGVYRRGLFAGIGLRHNQD